MAVWKFVPKMYFEPKAVLFIIWKTQFNIIMQLVLVSRGNNVLTVILNKKDLIEKVESMVKEYIHGRDYIMTETNIIQYLKNFMSQICNQPAK